MKRCNIYSNIVLLIRLVSSRTRIARVREKGQSKGENARMQASEHRVCTAQTLITRLDMETIYRNVYLIGTANKKSNA